MTGYVSLHKSFLTRLSKRSLVTALIIIALAAQGASSLGEGTSHIAVTFHENQGLTGSSTTISYQVIAKKENIATNLTVQITTISQGYGVPPIYSVAGYLRTREGNMPVAGGTIYVTVRTMRETKSYKCSTDASGYYGIPDMFTDRPKSAASEFKGDANYEPSTGTTTNYIMFIDPTDGNKVKAKNEITGTVDYSGTDPAAVLQSAVNALASTGGSILLTRGTYIWQSVCALPKDLPHWLKIVGESGVIIRLTAKGPRAFDFRKTADYDTFQYIWLEGFTVDCNNVGGSHHVVLGTDVNDAITTRININNIVIRNIKTINVPVDPTMTNHRLNVYLVVAHPTTGEIQTRITDVLVEDCDFQGGNQGVVIGGHGPAAVGLNVFIDRIYIHNVHHSLLSVQSKFFYSANFHVGDNAYGGYVHIADCYGEYSGDVGVEINNVNALVENTVIRDAYENMFSHTNYNNLLSANEQLVTFKNCVVRRVSLASTSSMDGFVFGTNYSTGLGSVILDNCEYYGTGGEGVNCAILFTPKKGFQRLDIRGFKVSDQISRTSLTGNYVSLGIAPSGGTIRGAVSLRGVDVATAGSKSGGTMSYLIPVYLAGVMDLEIDDLTIDVNVTGVAADTVRGIRLGVDSGSSIAGVIRGLKIGQITTDTNPAGIGIAGTGSLTIPTELRIENCDFSAMAYGTNLVFSSPTNSGKVVLVGNKWKGFTATRFASGPQVVGTAGENLIFGDFCYLKSDGKWWKADADQASTMPVAAMALGTISANVEGIFLPSGIAHYDSWSWTAGGTLYASTSAGRLTQTAPSGTGDQVQAVGEAIAATEILLNPS